MSDRAGYALITLLVTSVFCGLVYTSADEQQQLTPFTHSNDPYTEHEKSNTHMTTGNLYLWIGWWMSPSDTTTQRIAWAGDQGLDVWVDAGNWGSNHLTTELITYLHAHNVKVACRLWSNGGSTSLDQMLHAMTYSASSFGSVDKQMDIGPEIDAFMIDEASTVSLGGSYYTYYETIVDYVHALSKECFLNVGGHRMSNAAVSLADKISTEFCWYGFINENGLYEGDADPSDIIAIYPEKFIGISNDWGYQYRADNAPTYDDIIAPVTASGDRPAWSSPMTEERAVWDVQTMWDNGVFNAQAQPGEYGELPLWWESYIYTLVGDIATVATPTFSPVSGTYDAAQNVTVSCVTSGASLYYTINGTTPTRAAYLYESPVSIASSTTLKALAVKGGLTDSAVASAAYVINDPVPSIPIAAKFMMYSLRRK